MTNWNGALEAHQAMPDCVVFNRVCYGTHDGSPRSIRGAIAKVREPFGPTTVPTPPHIAGGWWTGAEWFNQFWPILSQNVGADVHVWANEWFSNKQPPADVDKFITFYTELMDACTAHGVTCTIGDFSVGTPGFPSIADEAYDVPAMQPMLAKCAQLGHWLNCHGYDLHAPGLVPREYTILRYKTLTAGHPTLKVIAGELANDPQDVGSPQGLFGGARSLEMMKTFKGLIDIPGCWWLVCDPALYRDIAEARWDKDDFSSMLESYFDWVAGA